MGTDQIRQILHLRIEQADERFLRILHAMTEAYLTPIKPNENTESSVEEVPPPDWAKPLTEEELLERLKKSEKDFEKGSYDTLEQLKKESRDWERI